MTLIGARGIGQKRGSIPSRIPRCSFSSRMARSTAATTLSLAEPPPALELPLTERAIDAPPTPPSARGALALARASDDDEETGIREIEGGGGVAAPAGPGKEISMKSGPELTSAPAARAAAARSAVACIGGGPA